MQYCQNIFGYRRRPTREVKAGEVGIGGNNPIRIQSMTIADTLDTDAAVAEIRQLVEAGCEIVRLTAPSQKEAHNLREIKKRLAQEGIRVPLVADIHYTPNAALIAAEIVEKVRINPGNYADKKKFEVREYSDAEYAAELERVYDRFAPLVRKCKANGVAMRIGVNHGSLSDRIMNRYGDTPEGMVESAIEFIRICEDLNFHDLVISMKASNPQVMIQAYRLAAARLDALGMNYPFHLGVTEAGDGEEGRVKSAVGIGALLEDGIGDTIRVSLTEDAVHEIPVARALVEKYNAQRKTILPADAPESECYWKHFPPFASNRRRSYPVPVAGLTFGGEGAVRVGAGENGNERQPVHLPVLGQPEPQHQTEWLWGANGRAQLPVLRFDGQGDLLGVAVSAAAPLSGVEAQVTEASRQGKPLFLHFRDLKAQAVRFGELKRFLQSFIAACEQHDFWRVIIGLEIEPNTVASVGAARQILALLADLRFDAPVVFSYRVGVGQQNWELDAAATIGGLMCDGIGDGVLIYGEVAQKKATRFAYQLLQAARLRITRTEFISCPSCGRTLFNLQTTTERIKRLTGHLKGIKIAIMGCIVNGPGEMADADFGYVGSGPGRVNLFVGKECVERNIPEAEADARLVELIRRHGKWVDP